MLCILLRTLRAMRKRRHSQLATQPFMCLGVDDRPPARSFDDRRRAQVFLRDRVYDPAAAVGYVALAYGVGVMDVSVASTYGRIALFLLGSWVGLENGGVVAGLAVGIIVMSAASTAGDLMQVFRTGYLTLTSPHAVLINQVVGTALGCLVNPIIFWMLYGGYHDWGEVVVPPYAKMYREMAMIAIVSSFS
ncbi:probable metal-nicotianamine transporter YSL17 [Miscanthus floridulus]|uniref:probable metal-nicotianamine transporter YSL17 n=1 Tax=Miscanthus floridulus TaxID=154761 RepID=UPI00345AA792